jgi:hypothetical protein
MKIKYIYSKNKYCKCGKLITNLAQNCPKCMGIIKSNNLIKRFKNPQKHPRYKDGRSFKKYYCKNCDKQIGWFTGFYGSGKCKSCIRQTKGGITLQKHYCLDCGKLLKKHSAIRCQKCYGISQIGKKFNKSWRNKISIALRGKNNHFFGKSPRWKRGRYKNIWMRSTWEIAAAKYLDKYGIKWLYEPDTFKFKNFTYTPDFYLPKLNIYIEIKGYWYKEGKKRYLAFRRKFRNIILLNKNRLKKLQIIK